MSDVQELIESIRVMLASSMDPKREELSELHDQLDEHIRIANKRLRECDGLLANGHRSEAIQLAEQEPNLLDFVGLLDFPELPEWNDFVAEQGLKVTPEIQIDIATDLNHAYSDDTPLERWLNKLRVYSLGRAPLKQRMDILRKIAKLDIESPHWQDDLRSYEQVRIRQMQEEFRTAAEQHDYEVLSELYTEVKKTKWVEKPQKGFVQKLTNSLGSLHQQHSYARLREVYRNLRVAHDDDDIRKAERTLREWDETLQQCDPNSEDVQDLQDRVAPVFDWIESHNQSQEAAEDKKREIEKLKRLIRSPRSTIDALETRYEYITEDGFELPEAVYEQYLDRIEEIESQADMSRKMKFLGIGVGILVLLIAAIVAFF
ncbi:MAG: hypothetical protein AB8G99_15015 [Planctomycetaceae bacterium]